MNYKLINDDCINTLKKLKENSVDSCVTDPPAGISFMGKSWDTFDHDMFGKAGEEGDNDYKLTKGFKLPMPRYTNGDMIGFQNFICAAFTEVYRVLKPGAHCFVWAIPRTSHHTAMGLERAGFEIRDIITHVFGSGFPKSHNISKAIQRKQGEPLIEVGPNPNHRPNSPKDNSKGDYNPNSPGNATIKKVSTQEAKQWEGWGTALKPASEHWILCRKPLSEKTVADNVLKWGTGGINIDGCRVTTNDKLERVFNETQTNLGIGEYGKNDGRKTKPTNNLLGTTWTNTQGRFPANFIHDGSDEVMEEFDKAGKSKSCSNPRLKGGGSGSGIYNYNKDKKKGWFYGDEMYSDEGSAARFFYCSKASSSERNEGLDELEDRQLNPDTTSDKKLFNGKDIIRKNFHPTVKPIKLMSYLIKMITPPNGIVIDPFMGSGSTGVACMKLGFKFIGIEKEAEYMEIAKKRIEGSV